MSALTLSSLEGQRPFPFDYSTLPAAVAQQARDTAVAINRSMADHVGVVGRHLLAAKEALPHGSFTTWAEAEYGMSARAAQLYMNAARWLEGKPETLSHLPPTVIYALSSPSTPESVQQEVVEAATTGALPEAEVIAHRIKVAKAEQAEVKRLVAAKPGRTIEEATKTVQRGKRDRARQREEWAAERKREADERAAKQAAHREEVARLVALHPLVMQEVAHAIGDDSHGFHRALLMALEGRAA